MNKNLHTELQFDSAPVLMNPPTPEPNAHRLFKFTRTFFFLWCILSAVHGLLDIQLHRPEPMSMFRLWSYIIGLVIFVYFLRGMEDDDPALDYNYKFCVAIIFTLLAESLWNINQLYLAASAMLVQSILWIFVTISCLKYFYRCNALNKL